MNKTIGILGGITFDNLLDLKNKYITEFGFNPSFFVMHPDIKIDFIKLIEKHIKNHIVDVTNIFGIDIITSKLCPKDTILAIPNIPHFKF